MTKKNFYHKLGLSLTNYCFIFLPYKTDNDKAKSINAINKYILIKCHMPITILQAKMSTVHSAAKIPCSDQTHVVSLRL